MASVFRSGSIAINFSPIINGARARVMIRIQRLFMSTKVIKTPQMGESITEGTLITWMKSVGQSVNRDEQIATIETDKVSIINYRLMLL